MNEIVVAIVSAVAGGIVTLWVTHYTIKRSEGKLRILRLEFHSLAEDSASLVATLVNVGRGDIIIDTVLLRSKQGQEQKKKPAYSSASAPNASRFGSPSSQKLAAEEQFKVRFGLLNLEFPPQDIQAFVAIDTRDRRYTKKCWIFCWQKMPIWKRG